MAGILTICTANICRSAGAAALFTTSLPPGITVASAGVAAGPGHAICEVMRGRLHELDAVDASAHRSRALTDEAVDRADLVLVASLRQRKLVLTRRPQAHVFTLREAALLARALPGHEAPSAEGDPETGVARFAHDLTGLRHHLPFSTAARETVAGHDRGRSRWRPGGRRPTEITISPFDVPDAHAAVLHGDHGPTFATLEPAVDEIATALRTYLGTN